MAKDVLGEFEHQVMLAILVATGLFILGDYLISDPFTDKLEHARAERFSPGAKVLRDFVAAHD